MFILFLLVYLASIPVAYHFMYKMIDSYARAKWPRLYKKSNTVSQAFIDKQIRADKQYAIMNSVVWPLGLPLTILFNRMGS